MLFLRIVSWNYPLLFYFTFCVFARLSFLADAAFWRVLDRVF